MLPTIPTPMTTTSTSLRRCATFAPLAHGGRNFRMDVHVTVSVLPDAQRLALELHTVFIDRFVVIRVSTGKSNHSPRHHVAIAAVDRIGEKTFNGHLQQ